MPPRPGARDELRDSLSRPGSERYRRSLLRPNALLLLPRLSTLSLACLLAAGGAAGVERAAAQVPLPEPGAVYSNGSVSLGHDVVVSVAEINELAVSSDALTLTVESGASAQDATTTYGVTTNGAGRKITVALSLPYATGLSLSVEAVAPAGATATARVLGTTALDLVTGLTRIATPGLALTYTATADAGVSPNGSGETRTVTFTLTDG